MAKKRLVGLIDTPNVNHPMLRTAINISKNPRATQNEQILAEAILCLWESYSELLESLRGGFSIVEEDEPNATPKHRD